MVKDPTDGPGYWNEHKDLSENYDKHAQGHKGESYLVLVEDKRAVSVDIQQLWRTKKKLYNQEHSNQNENFAGQAHKWRWRGVCELEDK